MDIEINKRIREYLLGQSTSDDAELVEERLLTDGDFYQEVFIVEDELVDQYVAGLLTESEKESFEKHFLAAPERREKLRFARNLKKYVAREVAVQQLPQGAGGANYANAPEVADSPRAERRSFRWIPFDNPVLSYSLAAVVIVVVALSSILIFKRLRTPTADPTGKVLAVELVPGLSRGDDGPKQITVSADTATVQLQLRIPTEPAYQKYRAVLQTSDGSEISRQGDLHDSASNNRITYQVPASLLKPGDYNLKLSGLNQQGQYEESARYYFRVVRH